jgi:hypothetical protein
MTLADVRAAALALPETTEAPHFDYTSFRVCGKIFATAPPDGPHLHVFIDELSTRAILAEQAPGCEELWWGKKLCGLRLALADVDEHLVLELLEEAWRRKAPKKLTHGIA